ncbi:MAG: hypothetical protein MUF33_02240 [Candidatus Nanopelagicales bacterium]|jgi:hypothetical protein|nr:hypothetical protein [Candidatus Nanopelagicales bacterium]MCU0297322.1 hypothetical protein [Candidatus Nanopelagicales bacterium]
MTTKQPAKKAAPRKRTTRKVKGHHDEQTLETQRTAISLRAAGLTWRDIGAQLGVDHAWVYRLVQDGIRENIAQDVATMREEDDTRLVKLLAAQWRPAMAGDTRAALACVRILERRARLWGMDAPVGIDATVQHTHEGAVLVIEADTKEQYMAGLEKAKPNLRAVQ